MALIFNGLAGADVWHSTARVLPPAQWAQWHHADAVQALAQQRLAQLDADIEASRQAGWQAGHAAGLAQGRRAGLVELLGTMRTEHEFVHRLHERLASLVEDAVRGLLVEVDDPQLFARRVAAVLQQAGERRVVVLRVALAQADAARAALAQSHHAGDSAWIRVEGDPTLGALDVIVEADTAIFDGRISEQIAALRDLLVDVMRLPPAANPSQPEGRADEQR
jgi:flagellar biosynthesis/type III secretory pathway protein FliH